MDQFDPSVERVDAILTREDPEIRGEGLWSGFKYFAMNESIVDKFLTDEVPKILQGDAAQYGTCAQNVTALFHMRVGSGKIPEYRQRVIDGLMQTEGGEKVWQMVMEKLRKFEEGRREATIYLPSTLDEGRPHILSQVFSTVFLFRKQHMAYLSTKLLG